MSVPIMAVNEERSYRQNKCKHELVCEFAAQTLKCELKLSLEAAPLWTKIPAKIIIWLGAGGRYEKLNIAV